MPGIVGIIEKSKINLNSSVLQHMVNAMKHEPFYGAGTYSNESIGLWIGWVVHRSSFSDCMPLWNETKDVCIIFSGEDFRDPAEIEALIAEGHQCNHEDASYLVHQYEKMGPDFIKHLNGWFSGVLIDLRERIAILFNDRYGLNRIYYHETIECIYFASEAKAILRVLPHLKQYDYSSLGEFIVTGSALQNRTLFRNISLLPPGSAWIHHPQQTIKKEIYFDKKIWEEQEFLPLADYYIKLKETFMRILPKYLLSKQDIALSLTGGLDSRLIIAAASRWPHRYPCYSFGGLYRDCADVKMAKQIAQECHQYHEVVPLSSNFFHEFPSLAMKTVYLTDGSMDVSGSVGLFVNRLAREIAPIRITGNYGGEVLRGLIAFKPETTYEDMFRKDFVPHLQKATTTFIMERDCRRKSFILFKQVPWHHYNRLAMEQSQLTIRSPYLDNEIVALSYQAPEDLSVNRQLILRLISEYYPALDKYPTDRGKISRLWFIPFNIRQWFEELIPRAEYAYDYGMPHWLAKIDHFLYPLHLEKLFLGWQKYYHFRIWYHNELSSFIKEVLLDPSTLSMSLLNGPYIERIVQAHIKGIENHTLEIHKLLTLVFIQKQLIEQ